MDHKDALPFFLDDFEIVVEGKNKWRNREK